MIEEYVFIDRVLFPVTALGPGKRIAIWVSGCNRKCYHCANPELWNQREDQRISTIRFSEILSNLIKQKKPDGITITGGEPFDQVAGLMYVLKSTSEIRKLDVLIYTGYAMEEIIADQDKGELLPYISVLIDGPYVDKLNDPSVVLRGSSNQSVHFLDSSIRDFYLDYMKNGRQIQNFVYDYEILSVGIHNRSNYLEND